MLSSIEDNGVKEINKCYDELADAVIGGIFQIQLGAQMVRFCPYDFRLMKQPVNLELTHLWAMHSCLR